MSLGATPARPQPDPVLPRVLRLLGPHRRRTWQLVVTTLAGALFGVGAPLLTVAVFDKALFPSSGEPDLALLAILVGAMVGLIGLAAVAGVVQVYLGSVIAQEVMHDLRDQLYRHLQRMPMRFFTGTQGGEIQSRLVNDIGGVGNVLSKTATAGVANAAFLVIALIAMFTLSWELALVTIAMLPVFGYISHRLGKERRRLSDETQRTLAEMSTVSQETLSVSGAMLVKVFGRQREAVESYREHSRRVASLRVRQEMVGRVFVGLAQMFFLASPAVVYLVAGFAMSAGGGARFTPGTLVAFTALQMRLFIPLRDLLQSYFQAQATGPLFERVFQYLDLPLEITDSPRARALTPSRVSGAIELRDVYFRYPAANAEAAGAKADAAWTLEGVSLRVEPGQLAALVGPTGAGKTTTTYLLARLYDVDRGAVTIDGHDVRDIRLSSLADLIGMVTQEPYLVHDSIRENLLYARPEAEQEELEAAARLAFIHDRIMELDDGYDTLVGERGYRLSGGEKQRLAIARAILRDPRILILDEATSAVDSEHERLVQAALEPLMADRTTIAIAHRLSTILAADVIFVLDKGRIVERGTHAELVAHGGLYARLYEHQFAGGEAAEALSS